MLRQTWFDPCEQEKGFLDALQEASNLKDWGEWNLTRLVYADWLHDREDPREIMVRSHWLHAGSVNRKKNNFDRWGVDLEFTINTLTYPSRAVMMLSGVLNSYWVLHFAPGTLRIQEPAAYKTKHLRFTHCPTRKLGCTPFDLGAHRDGLLALFRHPKRSF